MTDSAAWRLIIDPAAKSAWNMAVDEAILDSYAGSNPPDAPTLRLYGFRPATLSLGRLQDAATGHDPRFLRRAGVDLVRRPTGGSAVLHRHERTYSVIGRLRRAPFEGGVVETYRQIAEGLVAALRSLGAAAAVGPAHARESGDRRRDEVACFVLLSSHEITHEGRKLVGSAQLRRRGAFLQHGSIPLRAEAEELASALGTPVVADRFTDVESAAGASITGDRLDTALVTAFRETFGAEMRPGALDAAEKVRATRLNAWKYYSADWTYAGRLGPRETAHGPLL